MNSLINRGNNKQIIIIINLLINIPLSHCPSLTSKFPKVALSVDYRNNVFGIWNVMLLSEPSNSEHKLFLTGPEKEVVINYPLHLQK